jgi:glycosyltransferase involved in cell wall biosynthesis
VTSRPRVLVVQEALLQYRVPLFERLRDQLAAAGIELAVVHGEPDGAVAARNDAGSLDWATRVRNRRLGRPGRSLLWQPVLGLARDADLVVVEQASRMLANYPLLARRRGPGPAVALWGHGTSRQAGRRAPSRTVKELLSRLPHWWFPYTQAGAEHVRGLGFPSGRITVLQNAVDTSWATHAAGARIPDRCVFIGSLYPEKCLEFLIAAADDLVRRRPSFSLVVVGDGPQRRQLEAWAADRPHVRCAGALFGAEKAAELTAAQLVLNPGLVGLAVLDAFAARTPMVTTGVPLHSPEIEYLEHGRNGWVAPHRVDAFADQVDRLLARPDVLAAARAACGAAAGRYSLESMTTRFAAGIGAALASASCRPAAGDTRRPA